MSAPGPARGRALIALCTLLAAALAMHALHLALADAVPLGILLGPRLRLLVGLSATCTFLALLASFEELRDLRRGQPRQGLAPLRWLPVVASATWLVLVLAVQPFQRMWLELALGLAAGLWSALVLVDRRWTHPRPAAQRLAELALFSLALALPAGELGLRVLGSLRPSPLLARLHDTPDALLERFRCEPGELRFGFACNDRGYYDDALLPRAPGEHLIVAIGDSFHLGSVPHDRHLSSVCERRLNVPVHNLGVAGVGPAEYLRMLVQDALPLDPDVVVVSLFVGNDLEAAARAEPRPDAWLRNWFERDAVLLSLVPARLARVRAERAEQGTVARVQGERRGQDFPWIADPLQEEPTLSEEAFLRLESARARELTSLQAKDVEATVELLRTMRRLAGSTPLVVQLIPDEFQVEDGLWRRLNAQPEVQLERDRAQELLVAALADEGFACLDLLPLLRAEPDMPDGEKHLYHLRDTHFNARGNRVAGEALAAFLRPLLPEPARGAGGL